MNNIVSVIIPSYNRKDFINRAIESVLKQTYKEKEIVIVDDGSTDGTYEFLKEEYKENKDIIIEKNEKNSGAGFSRKVGYQKASGEYMVFMDDDDYYTDFEFFEKAIKKLKEIPNVSMVCANSIIEYVKEKRFEKSIMNIKGLINNAEYLSGFQQKYMKSNSTFTTVFRKKSLEESEFKDVEMVNDSSIYLRALLSGDAYILEDICGIYRIHSNNITFNLSVDFIIENLTEKKKVYNEIERRKLLENPESWLKKQVLLTATYYVQNNKIEDKDYEKLIVWCKENCLGFADEVINTLQEEKKR